MKIYKITKAVDKMNAGLLLTKLVIFKLRSTHGMFVGDGLKIEKRNYFLYNDNDLEFVATEVLEADILNRFKKG